MGLTGEEIVYALKKGSTWGTEVAAGADDGILGLPWQADPDNPTVVDDSLGMFFATSATPGQTKLDATFNSYLRYNDEVLWSMVAAWFGTAGTPATHSGGTLSKDHVLKINKSVDTLFFTLCAKLGTGFVESIPSWKIGKMIITMESGKPITIAVSGPGMDLLGDSAVNTLGTFASVTILETANRGYYGQLYARMNDQSAGALASPTDKIAPSKVVITLERKLTGVYGSYVDAGAGRDLIDEPTNDGQPSGTLSLTFPRLANNVGRLKIKAGTAQKADFTLTGPIIEAAIPYLVTLTFPNLIPKKNINPHKHGILENTREYDILGATAAPAGMTGQTDPVWCALTNKISTDLLA